MPILFLLLFLFLLLLLFFIIFVVAVILAVVALGTSPSEEVQKVELATPGGWQEKDLMREDNIDRIAYDRLK